MARTVYFTLYSNTSDYETPEVTGVYTSLRKAKTAALTRVKKQRDEHGGRIRSKDAEPNSRVVWTYTRLEVDEIDREDDEVIEKEYEVEFFTVERWEVQ